MNSVITIGTVLLLIFGPATKPEPTAPVTLYPPAHQIPQILSRWNNGYSESRFQHVLQTVNQVYQPVIQELGGELQLQADWSDGAVNMWAEKWGDQYILEIPGGFARYHLINEEAFLLTICHELGHLLGGEPRRGEISLEGQSDYFSTIQCSSKLFAAVVSEKSAPPTAQELEFCESHDGDLQSKADCLRHTSGMLCVTSWFAEIVGHRPPRLDTPDPHQVDQTLTSHPEPQCRLDTLVAGYLGRSRPRCWYQPVRQVFE